MRAQPSRIPVAVWRTPPPATDNDGHPATWHRRALDAYVSHAFTGRPGTERWCTRCTLMLPAGWQSPGASVPPACGDARVRPVMAMYAYEEGNPVNGVRLANPNYAGARVLNG